MAMKTIKQYGQITISFFLFYWKQKSGQPILFAKQHVLAKIFFKTVMPNWTLAFIGFPSEN